MALHTKWSSGDLIFYDGTQDILTIKNSTDGLLIGESGEGVDVTFYGDSTGSTILWDESDDALEFVGTDVVMGDGDYVKFGDDPDVTMRWTTGGVFEVLPAAANSDMYLGSTSVPLDVVNYGNITYRDPTTVATTGGVATLTLTTASNRFQFIDTTGARNVVIPSATGGNADGIQFFIARGSTSTGTVTVYDGSTSGGSAVAVIAEKESGILVNDGVQWKGIVGTAT